MRLKYEVSSQKFFQIQFVMTHETCLFKLLPFSPIPFGSFYHLLHKCTLLYIKVDRGRRILPLLIYQPFNEEKSLLFNCSPRVRGIRVLNQAANTVLPSYQGGFLTLNWKRYMFSILLISRNLRRYTVKKCKW
jgi:hypothetical protein